MTICLLFNACRTILTGGNIVLRSASESPADQAPNPEW